MVVVVVGVGGRGCWWLSWWRYKVIITSNPTSIVVKLGGVDVVVGVVTKLLNLVNTLSKPCLSLI